MPIPTRILIVDDEPAIVDVFSGLLEQEGYEVASACAGNEALKIAKEMRPDVVILDIRLPEKSGTEVCREIKSDPTLLDTFVVLFSGVETNAAATVRGLETGADDYIDKTIEPSAFLARIRTIIRLRDTTVALRQREQHYRGLVEILPDAVILTDREARILSVNPQALSMLELPSEAAVLGKSLFDLARVEDRQRMQTEVGLTLETGTMRNAEYMLVTTSGEQVPVEVSAAVTRDESGRVSGLLSVLRDSTERKLSETLLRERSEFNRRIISTAMDGFWMFDLQGRLLDVNDGYCAMSGYSLPELLAAKVPDVEAIESPQAVAERIAKIVRNGSDRFESRHRRKDGKIIDVEVSTTYFQFGEGYLFAFIRDITERKQAQQRLADALDLIESMMAASSVGILAYRASGSCVFANEAASRILNAEIGEIPDFRKFGAGEDSAYTGMAEETLRTHHVQTGEVYYHSPAGNPIWLDCHMDSFTSGGEEHLLVMIRDVTSRKEAEAELKQLPLRILQAQEAERSRVSRELHDGVNQIIASAKMRLHRVLEDRDTTLRPSAKEILGRCERLMVEALEENRRIAHNLRPSDLDELGFEVACKSLCRNFGSRTGLVVRSRIPPVGTRLPGLIELNLFRILQEALSNVEKHARARTVWVRLAKKNETVVLIVRDDGRGIRGAQKGRTRSPGKGQRLGILGMKERTALLGGRCEVDSEPHGGTTVRVTVPCNSGG